MMIFPKRSLLPLLVLIVSVSPIQSNSNDTNDTEVRKGRVNGRIVKLYTGIKRDPILCSDEGFKADPVDCTIFYRCTKSSKGKFSVFRFQCGPGTVYDPEIEICNHPSNTKRSECGGVLQTDTLDEDENNIEHQELPSPISTASSIYTGILESKNITTTTQSMEQYPEHKPITNLLSNRVSTTSERYVENSYNPWVDSQNKTQNSIMPTSVSNDEKSFPCISDGFVGDNNDCRKFYRCVSNSRGGFARYEFFCSESTIWDDNMQSCNHDWAVKSTRCGRKDNNSNKNSSLSNKLQNTSEMDINKNQNDYDNDINDNVNTGYGNKINNDWPHFINHEQPVTETKNKINEYEETINNEQKFESNKLSNYDTTLSSYPSNNLEQNHMIQVTVGDKRKINECTESGFMSDTQDCKKFYRCVDNGKGGFTKYEFSCSQQTVWDSRIEACNHAWAVKECGGKFLTESSITSSSTIISPSVGSSTLGDFNENNNYEYGNQINQEYIPTTSSTVSTTLSLLNTTKPAKSTTTECSSSGFFEDPNDCQKFFRCVLSDKGLYSRFDYKCEEGTLWDQNLESCNHAWAVKSCDQSKINNTTQTLEPKEPNSYTSVSWVDTTTIENSQNYNSDSGYNFHTDVITTRPSNEVSKTTLKNTQFQNNECQSSGFMGDTKDCKKFYRCVDNGNGGFTRHEFTCGDGTVWDSEIEACNHVWAVKECGASNMLSTANINQIPFGPTEIPNHENEIAHTENNVSPDHITSTTIHSFTSSNKQECKSNGFMADKNDCKKFYRCVDNGNGGFTQHEFSCGQGTAWDTKIEACNHEQAVENCGTFSGPQLESSSQNQINNEMTIPSTSLVTEIKETQHFEYSTMSMTTVEINHLDSKENICSSEGFFANSNDCKKFYRCVNDGKGGYTKYDFSCGDGTIWVQETQSCDHDTDVICSNTHTNITTTVKYESSSTENSITPSINDDTDDKKPTNEKCVSEGFYPSLNNCRDFYRCVNNGDGHYIKYEFSCAEGTAWDSTIESCNYLNKVDSCKGGQTKPGIQDEQASESVTSKTSTESVSKTSRASQTTSKVPSSTENKPTTTAATSIKSTTSKTTSVESTTVSSKPESNDICEQDGYYGNTQDCKKFYRCVSNEKGSFTKYDYTCGEGTIWDKDITACNHPGDVVNTSCKPQQEISSTTTSTSQHTSSENEITSMTTSSPLSTSTSSSHKNETNTTCSNNDNVTENSNTTDNNKNNTIVCKKAGFYANPSDCKKFYRCVDWENNGEKFSIFHFECGDGTIWDPALETCNHADSVNPPRNCNSTQQQNTTETSTTTENISTTTNEEDTTTTTKKSTTQSTSTQKSTTKQSTISQATTTTQQSTTQSSTTSPSTTTTSSTIEPTTQQPTTESSTTQQLTTQQHSTQVSTTDKSTTEQTSESTQMTQTTQEQTTKMSTEQNTPTEITESNASSSSTTESSEQTTNSESTTQLTTVDYTSQTESSTTETTTSENQTESSTESSTSDQKCPDTDNDQYLFVCPTSFKRHPKYCNLFYQCTEDNDSHQMKVAVFHCPNNTIYDESKVQCVEEGKSEKKCNGQLAKKHRFKRLGVLNNESITVTNESMACPTSGHFPFEKHEECSAALLKCELTKSGQLRGYIYRCPHDYIYWSISRRCEPLEKIIDCKNHSDAWTRRYDIPIETHNLGR